MRSSFRPEDQIIGFLVAFLNPKIAIFLIALFSQFVREDALWGDNLIMMSTAGGIDALW